MLKLKLPILRPPNAKNRLIGKDAGRDRGWDGWMASRTDGHESEQTLGAGDGQGSLECCNPRGGRVRHD